MTPERQQEPPMYVRKSNYGGGRFNTQGVCV